MEKEEKKESNGWKILGIIILAIIVYEMWFDTDVEDFQSCVQSCVSDIDYCTMSSLVYNTQREAYISEIDYQDCVDDLEYCINNCEG